MKKFFLSIVCALSISTMGAQTYVDGDTTYEFKPYNYLQFQASAGFILGEIDFSDLLSPARISMDFKGDTVQPFAVNEENRVCICVAE